MSILNGPITIPDHAVLVEYDTQQDIALGQLAVAISTARSYRWSLVGAVTLVRGELCQSELPIVNHNNITVTAAVAVDANQITATLGATAASENDYDEGYININDVDGEGTLYPSAGHDAVLSAGVITLTLASDVRVKVALTTSSQLTLVKNRYKDVIVHPSPATAKLVGVPNIGLTNATFGWLQVGGPCSVLTQGTIIINEKVIDSASANGAVAPTASTAAGEEHYVGVVMSVNATTEHSTIDLTLG